MRKPTWKSREWNRIHEYKLNKREYRHTKTTRVQFRYRGSGLSGPRVRILCPEHLSLEHNFDEVIQLLATIRDQSVWANNRIYIDFRPIRRLTPSGALVLAAELDRANHLKIDRRLRQVDAAKWDPHVRRLLKEMGFFKLLRTSSPTDEPKSSDDRYIEFRSGEKGDGQVADELRRLLEPHVSVPHHRRLYDAITEAMINVRQHAYGSPARRSYSTTPQYWWLSASFNTEKKEIDVMIYDQGSGVHATLPQKWKEQVREILSGDHASLIEAAHELSRSSTGERHRGRGFDRSIRRYIEGLDEGQGMYRIYSGRGQYTVASGAGGSTKKRSFRGILRGTFIQWRIQLT